jgi:hypothetical protein
MIAIASLFVRLLCDCVKPRQHLEAETLALRHQLNILQHRAPRRLRLRWVDRALFIWLYRRFPRILDAVTIVRPETESGNADRDAVQEIAPGDRPVYTQRSLVCGRYHGTQIRLLEEEGCWIICEAANQRVGEVMTTV